MTVKKPNYDLRTRAHAGSPKSEIFDVSRLSPGIGQLMIDQLDEGTCPASVVNGGSP